MKAFPDQSQINCRRGSRIKKAQTFVEYVLVIGVVTAVIISMSTVVRRGIQGMVKAVADQIGNQANADQQEASSGFLNGMVTKVHRDKQTKVEDYLGNITYTYERDAVDAETRTITNGGWSSGS